jgi:hypothetical protein
VITDRLAREVRGQSFHGRVHDLWRAHMRDMKRNGQSPTRQDIESIANQIDDYIRTDPFGGPRVRFL